MADPEQPRIIRFGSFEVDKRTGELRKNGSRVRLQQQPLQILLVLLRRRGDIVTREELRQQLWPKDTFVDFDHGLNAAVKRLREALGESADSPVFIETLARRGYRFTVPIEGAENVAVASTIAPDRDGKGRARRWALLGGVSVVALGAALVWAVRVLVTRSSPSSKPTITERKLTANSAENPIDGAAISPDGIYLAYSDATGLYLKLIRSGETHKITVAGGSGHLQGWLPDGAHVLVSRAERPGEHCSYGMFRLLEARRARSSTIAGEHRSHPMEHESLFCGVPRIWVFRRGAGKSGLHTWMEATPANSRRPHPRRFSRRRPGLGTGGTLLTSGCIGVDAITR